MRAARGAAPARGAPIQPAAWRRLDQKGTAMTVGPIRGALVLGLTLTLGLAGCATPDDDDDTATGDGGPQTESGNTENPPPDDVSLDSCAADETGWIKAAGLITNHSSKASTYFVQVEFVDGAGTRYAEGVASSSTVAPGQAVEWSTSGLTDARPGSTCRITSVDRFAA